jgi:hypothetical protein
MLVHLTCVYFWWESPDRASIDEAEGCDLTPPTTLLFIRYVKNKALFVDKKVCHSITRKNVEL